MEQAASFEIKVNNVSYTIHSYWEFDCTLYEVFTNCEKLFTLKKARDGNWITNEKDIVPISEDLVEDIGEALEQYEYQS
jgi:hypothetical protein